MTMENDSTLEQQVDRLIAKSSNSNNQYQAPQSPTKRDNSAAGPFWEADGSWPIQCFRCRGWGHPKRLCPSRLNYTRGGGGMVWDSPSQTMDQTPEGPPPQNPSPQQ